MGRAALIIVPIVLGVYALIDCLTSDRRFIRLMRRGWWIVAIVLVPLIGPVTWLVAGRPRSRPRPTRPTVALAPDDDPNFLRTIRTLDDEHEALLEQWERDRRRREGTGRSTPGSPPVPPDTGSAGKSADDPAGPARDTPAAPSGPGHEETTPEASPPDRDRDDDGTAV